MEQKTGTVDYVEKQLLYAGFGEHFNKDIAQLSQQADGKYNLTFPERADKRFAQHELEINVKGGKIYYNGFATTINDPSTGADMRQWFPAADNITRTEAVQLLWDKETPRAVLKTYTNFNEQAPENAPKQDRYTRESVWLQLDFNYLTKNSNYAVNSFPDFGLTEKMKDFTFKEIKQPAKLAELVDVLSKGGEYPVSPAEGGDKVYVSANPSRATVHIRDQQGSFLEHDQFRTEQARQAILDKRAQQDQQHVDNPGQTPLRNRYNPRPMDGSRGSGIHH